MARDYAKRVKTTKVKAKPTRDPITKLWMATAFAIVAFVAALFYLKHHVFKAPQKVAKVHHKKVEAAAPEEVKPRFEFYTMLQNAKPLEPAKTEESKPPVTSQFILQIATFKNATEADQVKIDLTLKGFKVVLQKLKSQDEILTRVQVGPFSTLNEAVIMKQKLSDVKYKSVIKKTA